MTPIERTVKIVLMILVFGGPCEAICQVDPMQELFDVELAFSTASKENGFRMANLMYAADKAIVFRPFEENARAWSDKLKGQDSSYQLTWYPSLVEMSLAGDLGYATGPFENISTSPGDNSSSQGQFVTVWKRQADGQLKFIMDFGSNRLPPEELIVKESVFQPVSTSGLKPTTSGQSVDVEQILYMEKMYAKACRNRGDLTAVETFGDSDIRFFYQREFYVRGLDMVRQRIVGQAGAHRWKPINAVIASSGDLGHVYGTHQYREGNVVKEGYYMRIWKRNSIGKWLIVVQVRSIVPQLPRRK